MSEEESESEDGETSEDEAGSGTAHPLWQLVYFLLLWQSIFRVSNAALSILLKFLGVFFRSFGEAYSGLNFTKIPQNVDAARKYLLHGEEELFITYVVCPSCDSIYDYDSCVLTRGTVKESKRCQHLTYPNHPQPSRRREYGTLLLKSSRSGKLIPIKVYPYQPNLCISPWGDYSAPRHVLPKCIT